MFIIPALRLRQEDQFEARLGYSKTPSQQIKTNSVLMDMSHVHSHSDWQLFGPNSGLLGLGVGGLSLASSRWQHGFGMCPNNLGLGTGEFLPYPLVCFLRTVSLSHSTPSRQLLSRASLSGQRQG